MSLRSLKKTFFEKIRKHRMTRILQDLDNYLEIVEILYGPPSLSDAEILVLSPHPDDESIGSGGTLRLLSEAGNAIDVLYLTRGAVNGDIATEHIRLEEAQAAARILGLRNVDFLAGQEGDLHLQTWLSNDLRTYLDRKPYQIIFAPWPYDLQSDHGATFRILKNALVGMKRPIQVWLYEVWSPLFANRLVNIDSVIDVKRQAIRAHKSQIAIIDYEEKMIALNQYRSLSCRPSQFAEGFMVCDLERIASFCPSSNRTKR